MVVRDTLGPGTRLGGYELERRIGEGGMAEVWVARRVASVSQKVVALKVISPRWRGDPRTRRMFKQEAELASLLNHSNIVQVFDEGEVDGLSYLVMELVDGMNLVRLRESVRFIEAGELRQQLAAHVVGQLLHGLRYAHAITSAGQRLGIVHRDVSPQNVLLSQAGDVKLTDFGVAHSVREESSGLHAKGKLRYMAPEQLAGGSVHPRVDLYAVGAILHELLVGEKFRGDFDDERILHGQILSGVVPEMPWAIDPALEAVRRALLEPDERRRVQRAEDGLSMLYQYRGYRDMRLVLSRLCNSLTGVPKPRTSPGSGVEQALRPDGEPGRGAPRQDDDDPTLTSAAWSQTTDPHLEGMPHVTRPASARRPRRVWPVVGSLLGLAGLGASVVATWLLYERASAAELERASGATASRAAPLASHRDGPVPDPAPRARVVALERAVQVGAVVAAAAGPPEAAAGSAREAAPALATLPAKGRRRPRCEADGPLVRLYLRLADIDAATVQIDGATHAVDGTTSVQVPAGGHRIRFRTPGAPWRSLGCRQIEAASAWQLRVGENGATLSAL